MRLLLRNCQPFARPAREGRFNDGRFSRDGKFNKRRFDGRARTIIYSSRYEGKVEDITTDTEKEEMRELIKQVGELAWTPKPNPAKNPIQEFRDFAVDAEWSAVAPHLMLDGYQYLEPVDRQKLLRDKLQAYEQSLDDNILGDFEKLMHDENHVRRRQAELYLHRMTPLTAAYLRQGVNFLTPHVLMKLVTLGKFAIIKELLAGGAFESVHFVTKPFIADLMPLFLDGPRNHFLLNILSFETCLLPGGDQMFKDAENQVSNYKSKIVEEAIYGPAFLAIVKNQHELNRLRLFWAYQHFYLPAMDNYNYILEELNHVTFKVDPAAQFEVTREAKFVLTSAYSPAPFKTFLVELVAYFKTFQEFLAAYAVSVLLLSKLRSIKQLLPKQSGNELHPIFQLLECNMQDEAQTTLLEMVMRMLSHEDHNPIEFENLRRSYHHWLKDYTYPLTTKFHSPLTRIFEGEEQPIEVIYERSPSQPAYAKFSLKLLRMREAPAAKHFGHSDMVKHILKKDYQPVLDHFMTTFNFTARKEKSSKLAAQMKEADRKLSFKSANEAALFKLKAAHNIFFNQSLPAPLASEIDPYKDTYDAQVSISTDLIGIDEHTQQFRILRKMERLMEFAKSEKIDAEAYHKMWQKNAGANVAEGAVAAEAEGAVAAEGVEAAEGEGEAADASAEQEKAVKKSNRQLEDAAKLANHAAMYEEYAQQLLFPEDKQDLAIMRKKYGEPEDQDEQEVMKEFHNLIHMDQRHDHNEAYKLYLRTPGPPIKRNRDGWENRAEDKEWKLPKPEDFFNFEDLEDLPPMDSEDFFQDEIDPYYLKIIKVASDPRFQVEEDEEDEEDTKFHNFFAKKTNSDNSQNPKDPTSPNQQLPKKKFFSFNKKNRFQFCSVSKVPEVGVSFEVERIDEYRRKELERSFLDILQSEQHVSTANTGSSAAQYLFLHGKNQGALLPRPRRTLAIEFTSVVGTRAKNYERFIRNSPFRYALPEEMYEQLLQGQTRRYNRHEFKVIVAHMAYYCDSLNDSIVRALCAICEKERIGYTFVEIAHLIKANEIRLSPEGLQAVTELWQRFDVINEDLLPFLRDYSRKMQIPLRTDFYAAFCRSLIKTKKFDKLEVIANAILMQIRAKPFKLDASMGGLKGDQVAVLEKEWKVKEQENYLRLYIELIEVIVRSLDNTVPAYMGEFFEEYQRMKPVFNERELGYAFVCYALKRNKIEELLVRLDSEPEKGTSFMYDCLLQTLLSNFEALEDLSEKMLDVTILKNRVVLNHAQIMKSLVVFKKSSSSNSFSKFLDHCLRFQEEVSRSHEIKREMFYILNNNVEDVSVGGIFNLLDFIFNEKREKERVEYRAIKLSEEEKARRLMEIQQAVSKTAPKPKEPEKAPKKDAKKKGKQPEKVEEEEKIEEEKVEEKEAAKEVQKAEGKETLSKKQEKKRLKKEKASERERQNSIVDQVMAEQEAKTLPETSASQGNSDEEFVGLIKEQTLKHESTKRKGLQSMSTLFEGSLELTKEEEAPKGKEKEEKKVDPKDAKDGKKKKGKK